MSNKLNLNTFVQTNRQTKRKR